LKNLPEQDLSTEHAVDRVRCQIVKSKTSSWQYQRIAGCRFALRFTTESKPNQNRQSVCLDVNGSGWGICMKKRWVTVMEKTPDKTANQWE
jgi:hypothetical protein